MIGQVVVIGDCPGGGWPLIEAAGDWSGGSDW